MKVVHTRSILIRLAHALMLALAVASKVAAAPGSATTLQTVVANDNRRPAGALVDDTLTLSLRAGTGQWKPEGPSGPPLTIEAFGEEASSLSVPAPMIRVPEGTQIVASIRNDLASPLSVHGLCSRDGATCPVLVVPPSETREVRFTTGRAGTYHYWASTMGLPFPFRELAGAFVVDPPGTVAEADRVLVITEWNELTREQLMEVVSADDPGESFVKLQPRFTFMINGLSWPATERLTYHLGESVKWRVINLSTQAHPMHLHGFYFEVDSLGDGQRDLPVDSVHKHSVVTQLLPSGTTMAMTWRPEREGNWLFHCHIMGHVSPNHRLGQPIDPHANHANHGRHADLAEPDLSRGMAGMVVGVTVLGPAEPAAAEKAPSATAPRQLTLVMQSELNGAAQKPVSGFVLSEGGSPPIPDHVSVPGPALLLRRGEPVEITLVNRLAEATAVHWHGIELDSYYDGVHGWSGLDQQLAPMIEPGGTFVVRFTPPHTGTFIYHTHLHDHRQLSSGLYGSIIVMNPDETFDPATDHVLVLGRSGVTSEVQTVMNDAESVVLNGEHAPRLVWAAGKRHRIRLINITPDDIFSVSLQTADGVASWTPLTKDGAPLPSDTCKPAPARLAIAVGETYDFEYQAPPGRKTAWLEVRSTAGKWLVQGQVTIK